MATRVKERSFEVECASEMEWGEPVGQDLSSRKNDIIAFIEDLRARHPGPVTGSYSVHSAWLLFKRVSLPPVAKKQRLQFLNLQVQRQHSVLRDANIRWDFIDLPEGHGEGGEALLVMSKAVTSQPIEDAFEACSITPKRCGVSSLSVARFVRDSQSDEQSANQVILYLDETGAEAVVVESGETRDCFWLPPGSGGEDDFNLLRIKLREIMTGWDTGRIVLAGDASLRDAARKALSDFGEVADFHPDAAAAGATFSDDVDGETFVDTMGGLLGELHETAEENESDLNLLTVHQAQEWSDSSGFFFSKRVVGAVLVLFIAIAAASAFLSNSARAKMFSASIDKHSAATEGVASAEMNLGILKDCRSAQWSVVDALSAVSDCLPKDATLKNVRIDKKGVGKKSMVYIVGAANSYDSVQSFVVALNECDEFAEATSHGMSVSKNDKVGFSIKCTLLKIGRR